MFIQGSRFYEAKTSTPKSIECFSDFSNKYLSQVADIDARYFEKKEKITQLKVLVVDDLEIARLALIDALEAIDIKAEGVESGEKALSKIVTAEKMGDSFDIVFMDWKMPDMNGIEATNNIHQHINNYLPHILMVSAFDIDEAREHANNANIQSFLEKPFVQSALISALLNTIDHQPTDLSPQVSGENSIPNFSEFTVLLVEDNMINQQVALGFLADTDINVVCAENGLIATRKVQETHFDLVLMDIQMPEMDGLTATTYIRETLKMKTLPILAMTAHAMKEDVEKSIAAGMNQHLTKPIEPALLYRTLSKFLQPKTRIDQSRAAILEKKVTSSAKDNTVEKRLRDNTSLSIDAAIARMRGKRSLYLKLVEDFLKKYQHLGDTMKGLYQTKSFADLRRSAHSLKSTSLYIGAEKLSLLAANLEQSLKDNHNNVAEKLNNVIVKHTFVIAELNSVFFTEAKKRTNKTINIVKANKLIAQLKPMIETSNIMAEDYSLAFEKLSQDTRFYQNVNEMHKLIADFSFDEAMDILVAIEEKINE